MADEEKIGCPRDDAQRISRLINGSFAWQGASDDFCRDSVRKLRGCDEAATD